MKKNHHIVVVCTLAMIGTFGTVSAQLLTTEVYPSAEELYEAAMRGEIDFQTYLNLVEIFETGVDTTELYLLEEIPNVNYFQKAPGEGISALEGEQRESYLASEKKPLRARPSGFLRIRNTLELDEDERHKSYCYLKSVVSEQWVVDLKINQGYHGRAEVSGRSAVYRTRRGTLRKITLGNFRARYGLGVSVGYRGRLLPKGDEFADETPFFPDYGGFNGLYVEGGRRYDGIKWLMHYDQNGTHRMRMAALDLMRQYRRFRWEGIILGGVLDNRESGREYRYYQLGTFFRYSAEDYDAALELAFPQHASSLIPAAAFESSFIRYPFRLRLSAWQYTDDYLNFAGGGRSGNHYKTVTIDSLDFSFRDRRTDQHGMLLKVESSLFESVTYDVSLSLYGSSRFEHFVKMLTAL
ncbi:MAG: hypothetical protein JSV44_00140, partial [Candidatus Zixiibacteriota bacterium]